MNQRGALRALKHFGSALLLVSLFEACSNNDDIQVSSGPTSISITSIAFGHEATGDGGVGGVPSELSCNDLNVTLNISNWSLRPQGVCQDTIQCGQVRVTLTDPMGATRVKVEASAGVDLLLPSSVTSGSYAIQADLVNDAGQVYAGDGTSTAQQSIKVSADKGILTVLNLTGMPIPLDCSEMSEGGAADTTATSGRDAGFAGTPDLENTGGAANSSAGEGGIDGTSAGAAGI